MGQQHKKRSKNAFSTALTKLFQQLKFTHFNEREKFFSAILNCLITLTFAIKDLESVGGKREA